MNALADEYVAARTKMNDVVTATVLASTSSKSDNSEEIVQWIEKIFLIEK